MTVSRTALYAFLVVLMVTDGISSRHVSAQDKRTVERLNGRWKQQAKTGQPFSYPKLVWHAVSDRGGDWGWIEPNWTYHRRGPVIWKSEFSVQEILSETEAIVDVLITQKTIQSVQGFIVVMNETRNARYSFLFRKFDFRDIIENEPFQWHGAVTVSGTHSVMRADGSTVKLIGIETTTPPPLPKHAAELGIGLRTWHDDTGKHSTRAGFDSVDHDKVVLVKPDGVRIEVPVDRLSKADQREIEKLTEVRPVRRIAHRRSAPRRSRPGESFSDGLRNMAINVAETSLQRELNVSLNNMRYKSNQVQWIFNNLQSKFNNARRLQQLRSNTQRMNQ